MPGWRRVFSDLKQRRFVDAYSVAFAAFVLAVLSLIGDILPDQVRWAALLAGVGILVLRATIPESSEYDLDSFLKNRLAFDDNPFSGRLASTSEVWIFAPSAINLLSAHHCELLRTAILSKPNGIVRVVVLDSSHEASLRIAAHQLDDSLDYPVQNLKDSLHTVLRLLSSMAAWEVKGSFEFRLLDYNPGFSLVALDPTTQKGQLIVEIHGFHNQGTSSRMHIEIPRKRSNYWYAYWTDQFSRIWEEATAAETPTDMATSVELQPGMPDERGNPAGAGAQRPLDPDG